MSSGSLFLGTLDARQKIYVMVAAAAGVIATGIFANEPVAYLCVALPVLLPAFIWIRKGALGIPVLPALSGMFFIYYAMPLLRDPIAIYGADEVVAAAATVGAFLIAATLACAPFLTQIRRQSRILSQDFFTGAEITRLIFAGLAVAITFHVAGMTDSLASLGAWSSVLRSFALTFGSIACYFVGFARASGLLKGRRWAAAVVGLCALIGVAFSSLFLVGGIMNGLAAVLGYVVTAKRIPWIGVGVAMTLLSILHAGKGEMRQKYWAAHSQQMQGTIVQLPTVMAEWVTIGTGALVYGSETATTSVFERASLVHILLLVRRATPDFIPYLEGETYALLPSMLVPRFVDTEKTTSQSGLNMLSLRYGLQQVGQSSNTTIGWGMVAEAYANFGMFAVIAVGALFGMMCGVLTRMSIDASPVSLAMMITIAAIQVMINLEMDFSYFAITLIQTLVGVLLIAVVAHVLKGRRRAAPASRVPVFVASERPLGEMS